MVVCALVKSFVLRFTAVLCSPITLCSRMCLEVLSNVQTRGTNDNLSLNHPLLVILAPHHLVYVYGYPFPDGSIKGPKISVV